MDDLLKCLLLGKAPLSVRSKLNRLSVEHLGKMDEFGLPKSPRSCEYACCSCGVEHDNLMVQDSVWLEICDKSGIGEFEILCCSCMEKFLGRRIVVDDVTICPVNRKFFLGWNNGVDNG